MKKIIIILALILGTTPAYADVYVKVDANGNAIGGAIVCDAGTCGAGSQFSQLTLQAGEQYVLQGTGQAGIGNNNPNTQVKVDIETKEWTVTRQVEIKPVEPIIINDQTVISYTAQTVEKFTPATSPGNDRPVASVVVPEPTPTTPPLSPTETTTATATATTAIVDTATPLTAKSIPVVSTLKTATLELSDVIWVIKNQINYIRKEMAKILIRTKGKK
jgi:hypothetical protein